MRFPKSLRWRLQIWYGALLVALLAGFGFTAFHWEKARQFRRIDEGLHERLSLLVDALRAGPERGPERKSSVNVRLSPVQAARFGGSDGFYFAIWMQGPAPIAASPNAPSPLPRPDDREAARRMRGEFRESFLFAAPVNCILVGRSMAAEEDDLHRFAVMLGAIGGAVLAAGLLGGWWLATRAIRPVESISEAAAKIAAGDLSQRIRTAETDSELGQLASVLNATFARLETAFAQQGRFTADAAHELRTPVSVMLTQTQSALTRERPAADYRETLEACQRAAQRMRRLIESLLELAHLDAGQEPLRLADCDLAKIAADGIELLGPLAAARGLTIHRDLPPTPCRGDAERLAQVVANLLGNAIDYNHEGGEIHVTTQSARGFATLTVRNTGPAIPAADLPHLFERFHRADKARTVSGHSGLGLAIAQAIVHAHGGEIAVASDEEKGTVLSVRLPE